MGNKDILCDMGYEDSVVFENPSYEDAIIGVDTNCRVVYSYDLMVEHLEKEDSMTEEEAIDFIDHNTVRSISYVDNAPIIMYDLI